MLSSERSDGPIPTKKNFDAVKAYREIIACERRNPGKPGYPVQKRQGLKRKKLHETAHFGLDDITVDRISDLNHYLASARHNLDLVVLVRAALDHIDTILRQMRTLSARAASENLSTAELSSLQSEINDHLAEIERIAAYTEQKASELVSGDEQAGSELH